MAMHALAEAHLIKGNYGEAAESWAARCFGDALVQRNTPGDYFLEGTKQEDQLSSLTRKHTELLTYWDSG